MLSLTKQYFSLFYSSVTEFTKFWDARERESQEGQSCRILHKLGSLKKSRQTPLSKWNILKCQYCAKSYMKRLF